jgi:hypothetical protein
MHYGLGVYRFEKNLGRKFGFYGTGGALKFRSKDPTLNNSTFVVSWLVPDRGRYGSWVSANLHKYGNGTLQTFYERTADKRETDNRSYYKDDNGEILAKIHGAMGARGYPEKTDTTFNDMVLTVTIEAASTT